MQRTSIIDMRKLDEVNLEAYAAMAMEPMLHPFKYFDDQVQALEWLGRPDAELAQELDALQAVFSHA